MQVSIIIPTYNEAEHLPRVLACLQRQTFRDFEIIVADNHSTDQTPAIANQSQARLVEGGLPARGRNHGASVAQGEILIFFDADVWLADDFLEKNLQIFQAQKLDFAVPKIATTSSDWRDRLIFWLQNLWVCFIAHFKPFTMGFAIIVRHEVFEKAHGFNEKMNLGEDADLGFRLHHLGYKFGILPIFIYVSARRFKKHGRLRHSFKMLWSGTIQMLGFDPGKQLDYEWGYEKKDKSQ